MADDSYNSGFSLPKSGGLTGTSSPASRRNKVQCASLLHEQRDHLDEELFRGLLLATGETGPTLPRASLRQYLQSQGLLLEDDQRLRHIRDKLSEESSSSTEDLQAKDVNLLGTSDALVTNVVLRAIHKRLIIPDFPAFQAIIREMYQECLANTSGKNADYIPQLARVDPNQFGVAVCTIDGQRFAVGDVDVPFCIQSCSKVVTYAIVQSQHGAAKVHQHVGVEPSGQPFDQIVLDARGKLADLRTKRALIQQGQVDKANRIQVRPAIPHNPCINAGAIMCASLVLPEASADERFDHVMGVWKKLCGCNPNSKSLRTPTFATSTYLSERSTADRNFCLAYMVRTYVRTMRVASFRRVFFSRWSLNCSCVSL